MFPNRIIIKQLMLEKVLKYTKQCRKSHQNPKVHWNNKIWFSQAKQSIKKLENFICNKECGNAI